MQKYQEKLKKANYTNPHAYNNLYYYRFSNKLILPFGVPRQIASSFYQLKIGHGFFKHYLYRIKRANNDLCRCNSGQSETPKHLLTGCRDAKEHQRALKESLGTQNLSLALLLHTTVGIQYTLEYLKNTRICTRKWHIDRNERLEEEEPGG